MYRTRNGKGFMRQARDRSGFTLPEVFVALVILGMCMGGLCALVNTSRELSDMGRDHYIAINLAKNRLERAKTVSYDDLDFFAESAVVIDVNGNASSEGRFQRTTTITQMTPNLRELVVEVGIRNRKSLGFDGENETARTFMAKFAEWSTG